MSKLKLSSNASGSGNVTLESPNTNSDFTVTVPSGTGALPLMKLETAKTATGTAVDFTGIPSWVKRITVMLSGVSTNGGSAFQIQIGAGGFTTTGYLSTGSSGAVPNSITTGFMLCSNLASSTAQSGISVLATLGGNVWVNSGSCGPNSGGSNQTVSNGNITLGGTLDRIRITTFNGTDTFDAGTINILYEG